MNPFQKLLAPIERLVAPVKRFAGDVYGQLPAPVRRTIEKTAVPAAKVYRAVDVADQLYRDVRKGSHPMEAAANLAAGQAGWEVGAAVGSPFGPIGAIAGGITGMTVGEPTLEWLSKNMVTSDRYAINEPRNKGWTWAADPWDVVSREAEDKLLREAALRKAERLRGDATPEWRRQLEER